MIATIETSLKPRIARESPLAALATVLYAGGAAGAIDLVYATGRTLAAGGSALRPWKGVAAALLGVPAVVAGGDAMALVGVALHFLIAVGAAAVFHATARSFALLAQRPIAAGTVFGVLFFAAMNYVILPLSVIGKPLYVGRAAIAQALITHILLIGLPIATIIAWRLNRRVRGS